MQLLGDLRAPPPEGLPASELPPASGLASDVLRDGMATARPFRIVVRRGPHPESTSQLHRGQGFHLEQIVSPPRALGPLSKWEEP